MIASLKLAVSKYSFIYRFPSRQENEYSAFMLPGNLVGIRLISWISLLGMLINVGLDVSRGVAGVEVELIRLTTIGISVWLLLKSYQANPSERLIQNSIIILLISNFGAALTIVSLSTVPSFYATNMLLLVVVLGVTSSGLPLRKVLLWNLGVLVFFVLFSQLWFPDPFLKSQYPNIVMTFLFIHLAGVVLERRRRLYFLNYFELEEQKKLVEDLDRQKTRIISILSHDIASPLNALGSLLDMVRKGHIDNNEFHHYVAEVSKRLDSVDSLLRNLVQWSKSQMDGFVPEFEKVDISMLLETSAAQYRPIAKEKGIEMRMECTKSAFAWVDKNMIDLVIRNLISNAVKFCDVNGVVSAKISATQGESILLCIASSGAAISDDIKGALFQANIKSTKGTSGEGGTGLGLALSASLMQLINGRIFLKGQEGGQNIFCLELPIK